MPLTSAERVRRHRDKLKQDPIKFEEYKKKHAALVKSKTKKVKLISQKLRKKNKERNGETKNVNKKIIRKIVLQAAYRHCRLLTEPIVPIKIKRRNTKLAKKYKIALKRIGILTTRLETARKKLYRLKKKYEKTEELVNKMKTRQEVLEFTIKQCKTQQEKRITKRIVLNENIIRARKKTYITNLIGLKGKIRKRQE